VEHGWKSRCPRYYYELVLFEYLISQIICKWYFYLILICYSEVFEFLIVVCGGWCGETKFRIVVGTGEVGSASF
jgi:hypothetical protein